MPLVNKPVSTRRSVIQWKKKKKSTRLKTNTSTSVRSAQKYPAGKIVKMAIPSAKLARRGALTRSASARAVAIAPTYTLPQRTKKGHNNSVPIAWPVSTLRK